MAASIYLNRMLEPNEKMLTIDLFETKTYLDAITGFLEQEYGVFKSEWNYYNSKSGWVLKMIFKSRNVLFVIPCDQFFRVAFTFGNKATDLVIQSDLPAYIKKDLMEVKTYMEGRTFQIDVKSKSDLKKRVAVDQNKVNRIEYKYEVHTNKILILDFIKIRK